MSEFITISMKCSCNQKKTGKFFIILINFIARLLHTIQIRPFKGTA